MKTITEYADEYVGHPQEIDEDLSVYSRREAYKAGMVKAFNLIKELMTRLESDEKTAYLYHFMDKTQERKED